VIWFDRNSIPPGKWPFLDTVRASLALIEDGLIERIDLREGGDTILLTGCLAAYRQAIYLRILDLAQSVVALWSAR